MELVSRERALCIDGRLLHLRKKYSKLIELYTESSNPDVSLKPIIHGLDEEIEKLGKEKAELAQSSILLLERQKNIQVSINSIHSTIASLQDHSSDDVYELRMAASQKIATLIDKVYLFPGGYLSSEVKNREKVDLMVNLGFDRKHVESLVRNPEPSEYKKHRAFVVIFRDRSSRLVRPAPEDPTLYISQLSSEGFILGESGRNLWA